MPIIQFETKVNISESHYTSTIIRNYCKLILSE